MPNIAWFFRFFRFFRNSITDGEVDESPMRRRADRERLIRQQEYLSQITAPRFPNIAGKAMAAEWRQAIAAHTFREVNRMYVELELEVKRWVKADHLDWLAEERAIESCAPCDAEARRAVGSSR